MSYFRSVIILKLEIRTWSFLLLGKAATVGVYSNYLLPVPRLGYSISAATNHCSRYFRRSSEKRSTTAHSGFPRQSRASHRATEPICRFGIDHTWIRPVKPTQAAVRNTLLAVAGNYQIATPLASTAARPGAFARSEGPGSLAWFAWRSSAAPAPLRPTLRPPRPRRPPARRWWR